MFCCKHNLNELHSFVFSILIVQHFSSYFDVLLHVSRTTKTPSYFSYNEFYFYVVAFSLNWKSVRVRWVYRTVVLSCALICTMPRKNIAKKNPKKIKKEKKEDAVALGYKCEHKLCKKRKPFVSLSNLNQHIRTKHKGVCWMCPYCKEIQKSKYSHERHIKRNHTKRVVDDLEDENRFQINERTARLTHKAKDILLKALRTQLEKQQTIIIAYKEKLKNLLRSTGQGKSEAFFQEVSRTTN